MNNMKKTFLRSAAGLLLALLLSVQALAAAPERVIPGGGTVGIKLYAKGLVITETESRMAARQAGLRRGDTILEADGREIGTLEQLRRIVQTGRTLSLTVLRDGREAEFLVSPSETDEGYRLGASVRGSIAGIGTVTFYDPETKIFGALGHGVNEPGGAELLPMASGFLVRSSVASVKKGAAGAPGALEGEFDVTAATGAVLQNSGQGIFGVVREVPEGEPVAVAKADEVRTGEAEILANVEGRGVGRYRVRIDRLYPGAPSGRNLLLTVTDERLLARTGGIVQGMSGSPILQDGRLVGAVTHVLVGDPARGYGIFAETMLKTAYPDG